jgi:hypothetical protein
LRLHQQRQAKRQRGDGGEVFRMTDRSIHEWLLRPDTDGGANAPSALRADANQCGPNLGKPG